MDNTEAPTENEQLVMYRNALLSIVGLTSAMYFDEDLGEQEYLQLTPLERLAYIHGISLMVLEKGTEWEEIRKEVYERHASPSGGSTQRTGEAVA